MTNAVTIDNYDITAHERYAIDQKRLSPELIEEAGLIPPHSEMPGGESSISSKWEDLFGFLNNTHPWANFTLPPDYTTMRNRFFSYSLSSSFDWVDADEEDDEEEKKRKEQLLAESYKKKIKAKQSKLVPTAILEKDRISLLKMVDSIQLLNGFLREIHARKLQYQKG